MKFRYAINWSIWIAIFTGLYALIYTQSPLYKWNTLPCTFIALPIYFAVGAKKEHYFDHISSAVIGVGWAAVSVSLISLLTSEKVSEEIATSFVVFIISIALCCTHFMLGGKRIFTCIPMIFGAVASTLLMGVDKWMYVLMTLCFGITLAFICQSGTWFLTEEGRWKIFTKKIL